MRPTTPHAVRTLRMYAPMRVATAVSGSAIAAATTPPSAVAEVRTARRLTESLLSRRAARRTPPPQQQHTAAPTCASANTAVSPPPYPQPPQQQQPCAAPNASHDAAVRTAVELALSYGMSAYLTHLTHQDDDDVYHRVGTYSAAEWDQLINADATGRGQAAAATESSTSCASTAPSAFAAPSTVPRAAAGVRPLLTAVESHWAALSAEKRVRWVTSTPQGRRALQHAMRLARHGEAGGDAARSARTTDEAATAAAPLSPSLMAMLSTYTDALVQPRQPRAAALAPPPAGASALRARLRGGGAAGTEAPAARPDTTRLAMYGMLHGAYAAHSNCSHLRARADAVQAEERRRRWHETLVRFLGGEGAFAFAHDVKDLQQPYDDTEKAAAPAAAAVSDAVSGGTRGQRSLPEADAALLAFCESLGIRSPRRVFVLAGVLPEVDAAASAPRSPLTLEEVRTMATALSAEYDKLREEAAQTALDSGFASPEAAVQAFERKQLARAVAGVQARLTRFEEGLPLLKSCVTVFSK